MAKTTSAKKAAPVETSYLAYPTLPFSQRSDRYPKKLFLFTFCLVFLILLGLSGLLAWSCYGSIEESVPGSGQIVPTDKIRRVMSSNTARIKKIYVDDDQFVHAGDILVELDTEENHLETNGMMAQLEMLERDSQALRAAVEGSRRGLGGIRGAWLTASNDMFAAQRDQAEMGVSKAQHEYKQLQARLKSQSEELKASEEQLLNYQTLFQEDGVSERELRDYEMKVVQLRGDLATTKEALEAQSATLMQSKARTSELTGSLHSNYLDRLADNERRITDLNIQNRRVHLDEKHRYIYAPVDGYVTQKTIHGPGEVVGSGQVLLSIVPAHSDLIAEIKVANKDLAYVYPKQRISLSLEAFPSQHFGKLYGTILTMSPSSQQSDMMSAHGGELPFYLLRVKLDRIVMKYKNKSYPLRPGMTLSADIITHKKPLLSFFLEPVQLSLDRAFRDPTSR